MSRERYTRPLPTVSLIFLMIPAVPTVSISRASERTKPHSAPGPSLHQPLAHTHAKVTREW
jgi:hypothetical protein